jgi:hypothetical protein
MNAPNGDKQTLLTLDISSVILAINLISKLS